MSILLEKATVSELRQLLAERFSKAHSSTERTAFRAGIPAIDGLPGGGIPLGALTEISVSAPSSGSQLLLSHLLQNAQRKHQYTALIDGSNSLDPQSLESESLKQLLWVRCLSAEQAMKATDLLTRDSNFPLLLLDLRDCTDRDLKKIPSTSWYRLQRVAETTAISLIIFTRSPIVASAMLRFQLEQPFSLKTFDQKQDDLLFTLPLKLGRCRWQTREMSAKESQRLVG
jgi:hypothetical protein